MKTLLYYSGLWFGSMASILYISGYTEKACFALGLAVVSMLGQIAENTKK